MLRKLRLLAALLVLPVVALNAMGLTQALAAPAKQAGPQTFTVYMGHEIFTEAGEKSSWQADRFYPESITINAGDSIVWKHDAGVEPHTVTLTGPDNKVPELALPPAGSPPRLEVNPMILLPQGPAEYDGSAYVNSGIIAADIPGPKEYKLTFTKPGTYRFFCAIHAGQAPDGSIVGMVGEVTVQEVGSALPKTPEQVEADAKAMMSADEQAAAQAEPEANRQAVSSKPGPNGTTIYHVNTGYQIPAGNMGAVLDYMRFSPEDIRINVGDTVEWSSPTPTNFHDVVFGEEPESILIEPQPSGPPKGFLNPDAFMPAGGTTYSGNGLYSSGIINGPQGPPFPGAVTSYSLTFSQPGRYEYVCALHYHNGMQGYVTVQAMTGGGGQPGMPRTGSSSGWLWALGSLAGALVLLAGIALRVRRSHRSGESF